MKRIIRFLKKYQLIGVFIGLLISAITIVIAESIHSNEVLYDNSNSKTSNDNVQDAIDDVYNIINHNSTSFSLLTHSPTGLSTELVGGLYRYQGVQDANNTVNNYICFGTTNKNDCISNTDAYMYRIIGINTSGQMKLIKKEALNNIYQWNSVNGVDWAHSDLYAGLNGSYFLTNTTYIPDSTWSNRIIMTDWHYAMITNGDVYASTIYNMEISWPTLSAKIGLMYLHDYYYGLSGENNCGNSGTISIVCKTSWIHLLNNDTEAPDRNREWTITSFSEDYYGAWQSTNTGAMSFNGLVGTSSVRPVFFLRASERIASGSGTLSDPYILS